MLLQGSILDLVTQPQLGPLPPSTDREWLGEGAWVEIHEGWVQGSELLLERLIEAVPWQAERRPMYQRVVDVPRLTAYFGERDALPDQLLVAARSALSDHYGPEIGEPLRTVGMCLYRGGRDSVAWHGDTKGRGATEDTVVAIVSLGARRKMLLRPLSGGPSRWYHLGEGNLFVMGGTCQRTWQHAVPKTAKAVGPRVSVQFRARGVS